VNRINIKSFLDFISDKIIDIIITKKIRILLIKIIIKMKKSNIKKTLTLLFLILFNLLSAQNLLNSNARKFMDSDLTLVMRDWNTVATLKSGLGESVSFFPVEITDLKTNQTIKALQIDMSVNCQTKSSWVDINEISQFLSFIEDYVIPRISVNTVNKKSNNYIFKSKEIVVSFVVGEYTNRLSVYLKDNGVIDEQCYFWTETQISKSRDLATVLQSLKQQ
jgi:hypothetical protein